jgi:hypothetical protein
MTPPGFYKLDSDLAKRRDLTPTAKLLAAAIPDLVRRGKRVTTDTLQTSCGLGRHAVVRGRRELRERSILLGAQSALPDGAQSALPDPVGSAHSAPKSAPKAHRTNKTEQSTATTADARWDGAAVRFVVPEGTLQRWRERYPRLDVDHELLKAGEWYDQNPKRRAKDHGKFLVNWLNRARPGQAKAGSNGTHYTPQQARRAAKLAGEYDGGAPPKVRHL